MYALFRQATAGNCNIERPGVHRQKGRKKWDAWMALGKEEISQEDAKERYINIAEKHDKEISGEAAAKNSTNIEPFFDLYHSFMVNSAEEICDDELFKGD